MYKFPGGCKLAIFKSCPAYEKLLKTLYSRKKGLGNIYEILKHFGREKIKLVDEI